MSDNQALVLSNSIFPTTHADKNRRSRLEQFAKWLNANQTGWYDANLAEYRDYLLYTRSLSPISVRNHLASIRQRYRDILEDNHMIDVLRVQARAWNELNGFEPNPANVEALVGGWIRHISNNISPRKVEVKVLTVQEHEDSKHTWLTPDEIDDLLGSIPRDNLIGYRNAAVIALLYMCGLREAEGAAVVVDDLYQTYKTAPALRVNEGKGKKKRMVVYGSMADYLVFVEDWMRRAKISESKVLRAFDLDGKMTASISVDAIQDIVKECSVRWGKRIRPHDLRRAYAKNLHNGGMSIAAIGKQMGHSLIQTTLGYIGDLDAEERSPK